MQKKILYLLMTLTFVHLAESLPVNFGTQEFDNLDPDFSDLGYEVEEEDLDAFAKLLGIDGGATKETKNDKTKDSVKTNAKTSGFKKKNTENKGVQSKHNVGDLKTFFKKANVHNHGAYDDADVNALAEVIGGAAAVTNGKETRTYASGKKTRGFHRVHHKDEYKKDQEFYEDDVTKGTVNKIGAKALGTKVGANAEFNKGFYNHDSQKGIHGRQGYLDNGFLDKQYSGFSDSQGFDGSFSNEIS